MRRVSKGISISCMSGSALIVWLAASRVALSGYSTQLIVLKDPYVRPRQGRVAVGQRPHGHHRGRLTGGGNAVEARQRGCGRSHHGYQADLAHLCPPPGTADQLGVFYYRGAT
jgi:hypothetical protein